MSHLLSQLVVWWFRESDLGNFKVWGIIDDSERSEPVRSRVLDQSLAGSDGLFSLCSQSLPVPVLLVLDPWEATP